MKEKIGIISDTHGLLRPEVLEILKRTVSISSMPEMSIKTRSWMYCVPWGISMWSVEIMIKTGRKISAPV